MLILSKQSNTLPDEVIAFDYGTKHLGFQSSACLNGM